MSEVLLHLVLGGTVSDPGGVDFVDPDNLHNVGIYPNYNAAFRAWQGASHLQVDDAYYKYVIVHLHRMLDPSTDKTAAT